MKRILLAVCVVLAATTIASAQEAHSALPGGAIGLIEIQSPDVLRDNITAFAGAILPGNKIPPLHNVLFGQVIRSYNPGLIDGAAPLRIFIGKGPSSLTTVAVFKAKAVAAYRKTLLPGLVKKEEKDGITIYSEEKRGFDREAYAKATPEEKQDYARFVTTRTSPFAIAESGDTIICGDDVDAVTAMLEVVKQGTLGSSRILAGNSDITMQIAMPELIKSANAGQGGILGFMRSSATMLPPLDNEQRAELRNKLATCQFDYLEAVLAQFDKVTCGLTINAAGISFDASVEPLAGSDLAKCIAATETGVPVTINRVPRNCVCFFAAKWADAPFLTEETHKIKELSKEAVRLFEPDMDLSGFDLDAHGTDIAGGMPQGKGFTYVGAVRVKDPAAATMISELAGKTGACMFRVESKNPDSITFTQSNTEYKGNTIRLATIGLGLEPIPAQATPMMDSIDGVRLMFGNEFITANSVVGNDLISAVGPDSLENVKRAIDGHDSILDDEKFKAFAATLPSDCIAFGRAELGALLDTLKGYFAKITPMLSNFPDFEAGPGATLIVRKGGAAPNAKITVPAQEIKVIVDGFKKMMEQQKPEEPQNQ